MSEGILFGIGFVIFVGTTTATLLFGYFQFNRLYREDRATGTTSFAVATDESGLEVQAAGDEEVPGDARSTIARRPATALAVSVR